MTNLEKALENLISVVYDNPEKYEDEFALNLKAGDIADAYEVDTAELLDAYADYCEL